MYVCMCIYCADPGPALGHRVSRPRGTGSVGDSVGECACARANEGRTAFLKATDSSAGTRVRSHRVAISEKSRVCACVCVRARFT